jgi:hypothetical protein
MRRTSLALLCIALCMAMILPVSAKKGGGGQSPTTATITGDIAYPSDILDPGPVKYQNTKRSFTVTIGVEGKKKPSHDITFSGEWHDPIFSGKTFDSYRTFVVVKGYKYGTWEDAWVAISHETDTENYVMSCLGTWDGDLTNTIEISIYKVTTSDDIEYDVDLGFVIDLTSS